MLPDEVALRASERATRRDELKVRLIRCGPSTVYGGLLAYALNKGWHRGWAYHAFKEIFGTPPRWRDRGPPVVLQDFLIEEWAAMRIKKPRKIEKPAPLLDQAEQRQQGFVAGTLMTPEDYEAKW
jgi:hypothetical protein